ncbi:MAG: Xaa-Pro peptidase family protein [Tabrizicola sp.]|jgi:Xaa-Pro dipeptidase|uniref:M24 family metallopeptidase n=1 Tax=Tabrizicola sp. TaxID=2005166 RepID=UPI003BB08582
MRNLDKALQDFTPVSCPAISDEEYSSRLACLRKAMLSERVSAVWLDASASLTYYCGLQLGLSERIHGALVKADGRLIYVTPQFERPKLESLLRIPGEILVWEEDEDPFEGIDRNVSGRIALDPAAPFRFADRFQKLPGVSVQSAENLVLGQRAVKSAAEIAIMQVAMDVSYRVHKAVHAGLQDGISAREVCEFISAAHRASGLDHVFAAAQFAEATAYPHGVPYEQRLSHGDLVLIDLGARLHGYHSDITRSYAFGRPTDRQRFLWNCEKAAHAAAMAAVTPGATCRSVDQAARSSLKQAGFGPGYAVPGLPHRTGHGIGLELHERPWIVGGDDTVLVPGMCFSIEPMLCVYGEGGVRLEDIVYMTETGGRSFCPPAAEIDAPFDH